MVHTGIAIVSACLRPHSRRTFIRMGTGRARQLTSQGTACGCFGILSSRHLKIALESARFIQCRQAVANKGHGCIAASKAAVTSAYTLKRMPPMAFCLGICPRTACAAGTPTTLCLGILGSDCLCAGIYCKFSRVFEIGETSLVGDTREVYASIRRY